MGMNLQTLLTLLAFIGAMLVSGITIYLMIYFANRAENRAWSMPGFVRVAGSSPMRIFQGIRERIKARRNRASRHQAGANQIVSGGLPPLPEVVIEMTDWTSTTDPVQPYPAAIRSGSVEQTRLAASSVGVRGAHREARASTARPLRPSPWLEEYPAPLSPQRSTTM